eukprot:TRINITY_DN26477_c0_g2_i1.p2 TRINITY_DN26477_c0_g2~~TRINITY_DN26477_c0_g2_i1.p2  ORF type:complete len:124 (+),score=46.15 TRINITY_DN26477_c0_g2_i1:54-425(+)
MGHENWPWPQEGPQQPRGQKWWKPFRATGSIASRVRSFELLGDVVILGAIGFFLFKAYTSDASYKTKKSHLIEHPPALVAQEFSFSDASANRKVSRTQLQEYREELAGARMGAAAGRDLAFKY